MSTVPERLCLVYQIFFLHLSFLAVEFLDSTVIQENFMKLYLRFPATDNSGADNS